jgi:hypothetical protein
MTSDAMGHKLGLGINHVDVEFDMNARYSNGLRGEPARSHHDRSPRLRTFLHHQAPQPAHKAHKEKCHEKL